MKGMSAAGSAVLLTAVSLFSQAVGFVYRVVLSRMVGPEVMGLYHLVMPVFSVLLSLTAVGFTAACSNLTARYRGLGNEKAAGQVLRACLSGFLAAFVLVALVSAPLSDAISVSLLGDARAQLGLLALLPCVLLTGLENIHKHAFYGAGRVRPPALTELCEPVLRAGAVLGLLWRFLPQNPERTVGIIVCGMTLCEVFSALTLTLLCRRLLPAVRGQGAPRRVLGRKVLSIAAPVGLTALLGNLMGAATTVLIPGLLVRTGQEVSSAMSAFGVLCGMTLPLLTLPSAFISAMGLVLLPRLARSAALGQEEDARRQVAKALTVTARLILPSCTLLSILAPTLAAVLFRQPQAGLFAAPLSLAVALSCFESVLAVCLNALGKQALTAGHSLVCGAVQLLLTAWRMSTPGVGLRGYVEALVAASLLGVVLNARSLRRVLPLRPRIFSWLVAPGLSALLAGLCVRLLLPVLAGAGLGPGASCLACLAFGGVLSLAALCAQGETGLQA